MTFEKVFGEPGERPGSYWQAWLGDWFGTQPRDMGDLTPTQMVSAYKHATQKRD